jgi:hypothetical protein
MKRLELYKGEITERERVFLVCFYHKDSETRFNTELSAKKAGFAAETALAKGQHILKKYGYAGASASLTMVGITKPYLASKLFNILENGEDRDQLKAVAMSYSLLGESTDDAKQSVTMNNSGPVMVIVGANPERLKSLREAKALPTPAELEAEEDARCQARLDELRQRNRPHVQKENILECSPLSDHNQAEPEAGGRGDREGLPDAPGD